MNKSIFATFVFASSVLIVSGQTHTVKTSVYFQSDKFYLLEKQTNNIDTLLNFLSDKEILNIVVEGNTDSDADTAYNNELSRNRARTVQKYLEEKLYNPDLFKTGYFGEDHPIAPNIHEEGKQKNRRVDIIVVYKEISIIVETKKCTILNSYSDSCKKDTTIYLPQGSKYSMSICDYLKYKDCIKIVEYITPESILNSDMTTITTNNEQLVTGGIFNVQLCNDSPLVHPIIFRVPVPYNGKNPDNGACGGEINYRKMTLWGSSYDGSWRGSKKIELIKSNDTLFFEFRVSTSGKYNLDYKMDIKNLTPLTTRFKSKGGIKLLKVSIMYASPKSLFKQQYSKGKHKMKFDLPRCPNPNYGCECTMVKATGINSKGDTLLTYKCLNEYKKRVMFGKCKLGRNWGVVMGFIRIKEKGIYRKYIFKEEDWIITPRKR
jgi:hypothetical protein